MKQKLLSWLLSAWPLVIGAFLFIGCSLWAEHEANEALSFLKRQGINLPPSKFSIHMFLRRDLSVGIPHLVCLVIGLILGLAMLRSHRPFAGILLWGTLLWSGPSVWRAAVIQTYNEGTLHDPRVKHWENFGDYLVDPIFKGGETGILVLAFLLAIVFAFVEVRKADRFTLHPRPTRL